jgi:hypothetical protein
MEAGGGVASSGGWLEQGEEVSEKWRKENKKELVGGERGKGDGQQRKNERGANGE